LPAFDQDRAAESAWRDGTGGLWRDFQALGEVSILAGLFDRAVTIRDRMGRQGQVRMALATSRVLC
jgi:hypothetical protein